MSRPKPIISRAQLVSVPRTAVSNAWFTAPPGYTVAIRIPEEFHVNPFQPIENRMLFGTIIAEDGPLLTVRCPIYAKD